MSPNDRGNLPKARQQPRAGTASAYNYPVDTGFAHHPQGVTGLPDVAVSQHRNLNRCLERRNGMPVSRAGVSLLGGTPVQRDRGTSAVLGDSAGVKECLMITVDPDPGLDR